MTVPQIAVAVVVAARHSCGLEVVAGAAVVVVAAAVVPLLALQH